MPRISLETDPPPIVRVLGVTLRRAAADAALAATLDRMAGTVALRSTVDPQAATITFDHGDVSIRHGAASGADITISADLNTMGRPGAPKPSVRGAVAHPKLALAVSKVLEPPVEGGWRGAARDFWAWSEGRDGRPAWFRVVCTDEDGASLTFGDDTAAVAGGACELHGPGWALVNVLTGGDHLGQAALEGRVQGVADFPTLNRMIGLLTRRMLGDDG